MMINKDINKLQENFHNKVEDFMKEVGNTIFITETRRSQDRQNELYEQGRTTPGKKVTWTRSSKHSRGLAIDIAFKGGVLFPSDIESRNNIYNIAKKYGIRNLWEKDKLEKAHLECDGTTYDKKSTFKDQLVKMNIQTAEIIISLSDNQKTKYILKNTIDYFKSVGF